ncbi:hypothetical protein O6H91_16G039700 [Diphasiastrum complanatum]|nr:hypothetical protein O6H91_16G039700 [Diphasiastrum complanatum]KAJ7527163.1 hypothetical protein O6H91_16G039700 [Diphasiastrum complanatum]KAJ7527164.1 hypothetical protein O6H91_16G039700 [Diphasiastrum complanatum]KAJ7527166.1 hypothetical protein O6H91_16G039700 [Diphasiastrum complanatum]KAJ7527167.1 hypothetical protein O6H91_16G039700 [Diphasiastrum complanatum]
MTYDSWWWGNHADEACHEDSSLWPSLICTISHFYGQDVSSVVIHLIFLVACGASLLWQRINFHILPSRFAKGYRPVFHSPIHQIFELGSYFRATLCCCIYLLLLNSGITLQRLLLAWQSEWSKVPTVLTGFACVQLVTWVGVTLLVFDARRRTAHKFALLLRVWWVSYFCLCAYKVGFLIYQASKNTGALPFAAWANIASSPVSVFLCIVALRGNTGIQFVVHELQEPLLTSDQDLPGSDKVTPYWKASPWSLATLSWLNPLLAVGVRKPLEHRDIPRLAPQDRAKTSYLTLKTNWERLKAEDPSNPPSLFTAIVRSFWREALYSAIFAAMNVFASYVGPYSVNDFVEYLGGRQTFPHEGYVLAAVFFAAKLIENLTLRQWYLGIDIIGLHVRSALTAFVYDKGLRLSNECRQSHTSGEIINYMAVDVQRIGDFSWYLHDSWVLPLQIILALIILYRSVGVACFATLIATVLSIAGNTPLAKMQEDYQDKLMTAKDDRMKATSECLRSMRILKLQAWENRYLAKLENLREIEFTWLRKALFAQAAVTFIFWGAPMLVSAVTFGTCIILGIPLTAGRVLSALATFRVLQEPLRNFPDLVSNMAQTKVSLDRLWTFLQEPELQHDAVIHVTRQNMENHSSDMAIVIEGGKFTWDQSVPTPTLTEINLQVKSGMRVAVCGVVGAGKSSLLSCILGEIPKLAGKVTVAGTTAYVAQSSWIQSGKIQDNILFGSPMDKRKYEHVLNVCALEKDMHMFSHGDQTEIGERGINLSGGQKQRIQLARALYQDADIYLLDDPFSAVDAHTGTELFKKCVLGALSSKTLVFVTHQVEFLPAADLILVLRNGEIIQAGKYEELLQAGTDFSALVDAHNEAIEAMDITDYLLEDADKSIDAALEQGDCPKSYEEDYAMSCEITKVKIKKLEKRASSKKGATVSRLCSKKDKSTAVEKKKNQLMQEEEREKGSVSMDVYWSYLTAAHKGALIPVILMSQTIFQLLQISSNWWMAWASPTTEGGEARATNFVLIAVYIGLAFGSALFVFLRALLVSIFGLVTAQKLFLDMMRCIFRAPMLFFDSTPAGRILNRASTDQSVVDLDIPFRLGGFASSTIQLLGIIGVMSRVTWQILFLFVAMAAISIWMQQYYMASARELSRLVGIQKAPIIHHYGESIAGATTIRGFGQERRFIKTNLQLFDLYSRPFFNNFAAIEWLCLRMEMMSTCVFASCMALLVSFPIGTFDPSMAGLAVTYGLNLNQRQSRWVLSLCKMENKIISVERIKQYTIIPSEAAFVIEGSRPSNDWPLHGAIDMQDLQVRYSPRTPVVLHGVTCTFPAGKKIGVVGRTGSGKSTLIQALFRMVEPIKGRILIDGLDISTIGLHDLRSKLGIIPQDPTLFEGTVRANLDPLEDHSDLEIWEAVDKCQLGDVLRAKEDKLDSLVSENGENWSVGQRQLFCLGRALLKRARILILDEATASVDTATDGVIQRTIRAEFVDCTVITVAHRIPTVVDSDLVLVLSDGKVAEYDAPLKLLEEKSSLFLKLVSEYSMRSSSVSDLASNGHTTLNGTI